MQLSGPKIELTPYDASLWPVLHRWFYDVKYQAVFRGHGRALSNQELQAYPQVIGGEVFFIRDQKSGEILGLVEGVPDYKRNLAFFLGILVDEKYQKSPVVTETLILFFNYMFNHRGFRKAKVDILANNTKLRSALEETGFTYEGKGLDDAFIDGKYQDELKFSMFAQEFNFKYRGILDGWST